MRTIARALGTRLTTLDPDQIIQAIDARAEDLVKARGRITELEGQLEATDSMKLAQAVGPLLTAAKAAIDEGRLDEAEKTLSDAGDRFA